MILRRISAVVALLLGSALLLTGCGGSGKQAAACPQGSASPLSAAVNDDSTLPTVSGIFGHSATITVAKGAPTGKFVVKVLSEGSGPVVGKDDIVGFGFLGQTWSGKTFADSYTDGTGTEVVNMHTNVDSAPLAPMFAKAMVGYPVGSRVLVVAPNCRDTLNMVFDITAAAPYESTAQGATQSVSADLPKVTMGDNAAARFTITDAQRHPRKLDVGVLIKGKGPAVKPGQKLITQYTGALLKSGAVFGSSWTNGGAAYFVIGKGQVIAGWDKGLVGQTVGSRVILSIPAADGYGAQGRQGIPANSDLVFVVDILGAM